MDSSEFFFQRRRIPEIWQHSTLISLQLSQGYCIGVAAECRWRAFSLFYLFLINSIMSFARMEDNPLPGPGPAPAGPPEEVPWWLKYGGRGLGTFGGIGKLTYIIDFAI